jgi:hypothetical protein
MVECARQTLHANVPLLACPAVRPWNVLTPPEETMLDKPTAPHTVELPVKTPPAALVQEVTMAAGVTHEHDLPRGLGR